MGRRYYRRRNSNSAGAFFAIKNYCWSERLSRHGERGVGLFSRLLGRLLD